RLRCAGWPETARFTSSLRGARCGGRAPSAAPGPPRAWRGPRGAARSPAGARESTPPCSGSSGPARPRRVSRGTRRRRPRPPRSRPARRGGRLSRAPAHTTTATEAGRRSHRREGRGAGRRPISSCARQEHGEAAPFSFARLGGHATPARGEAERVGAEVDDQLVEALLVAAIRKVRSEALALEGDARLLGLRVDLLDDAVHEPRQIERLTVELHEPRPQARRLEDLIDEPEQPLGALPDDVHEAFLLLRERS